jgi:hypothetical protein
MIGDPQLNVAKLYNMLPADAGDTSEGRTAATNATVRTVFIIGPDKKIKLMLAYPIVPIAWRLERHLSEIALQRLGRPAIARVAAVMAGRVVLFIAEVLGHLGLHSALQQRFGQLLQQPGGPHGVC